MESSPPVIASEVIGENCTDFVPPTVGIESDEALAGSTRRILERPWRLRFLEPRVRRVEFGDRSIHVFDVERDA